MQTKWEIMFDFRLLRHADFTSSDAAILNAASRLGLLLVLTPQRLAGLRGAGRTWNAEREKSRTMPEPSCVARHMRATRQEWIQNQGSN